MNNSTFAALLPEGLAGPAGVLSAHLTSIPGALAVLALAMASLWLLSPGDDWAKLPGPPPSNWLLGHMAQLNVPNVHRFFQDCCQQYGAHGMYRIRLLHMKFVILSDPALVQAIVSRKNDFPKAAKIYDGIDELVQNVRSLFNTHNHEEWKLVRKATAPAFSPDNIRKAFPAALDVTSELCDVLAARVSVGQSEVEVSEAAMRVTLDVIGATGYGYDFKARTYASCELFEVIPPLLAEFTLRATNPLRTLIHRLLPFLPEAKAFTRRCKACHRWWDVLTQSVLATDLEAAEKAGDNSLRVCLARMPASYDLLRANVGAYLIGGFETTAHSIAWSLYEIAANPGVQARLAAELAAKGLLGPAARQLAYADLAELTFLNCVFKEAMRLHPVVATGTVRQAPRDISLGGYRLAKGTILWVPFIAILTSKHNWERGEEFWPERWEQQQGTATGVAVGDPAEVAAGQAAAAAEGSGSVPAPTPVGHASNPSKTYLPFSDGPHDCIGQNLALMEGRLVLAMLVGRFELAVAPCMGGREEVRAQEIMKLTLQSINGIRLLLTARQ